MDTEKLEALAKYLECEVDDLSESIYDDNLAEFERDEYLILTDEEADEEAKRYILDSVWAFNPLFLQYYLLGNLEEEDIRHIQERCESSNNALRSLLKEEDDFVNDAISSDGRGHFLSFYDGAENEVEIGDTWYFIYRQ